MIKRKNFACGAALLFATITLLLIFPNPITTPFRKPQATRQYQQTLNSVKNITQDTLLKEDISGLYQYQYEGHYPYPDCLRGGGIRIYGANRPYTDIVSQYSQAFEKWGWIYFQGLRPPSPLRDNYHNPDGSIWVDIVQKDQDKSQHSEWQKYQT